MRHSATSEQKEDVMGQLHSICMNVLTDIHLSLLHCVHMMVDKLNSSAATFAPNSAISTSLTHSH